MEPPLPCGRLRKTAMQPQVHSFFDPDTFTVSHIVADPATKRCAIIDSILDYDPASGRTQTASAEQLAAFVQEQD